MNKIIPITVFVLLLLIIPVAVYFNNKQQQDIRSHASPSTTISFSPSSITRKNGETFTLLVSIDTGTNTVSAAKLVINTDETKVKITGVTADTFLTNTIVGPSYTASKGTITVGSPPTSPQKGTGSLAKITFQVVGTGGSSQITFTGSQVAGIGEQSNVLSQSIPATLTIESSGTAATPTLTSTPVPTATPTTASGGTNSTPTHTPTATPTGSQQSGTTDTDSSVTQGNDLPVTGAFDSLMAIPIVSAVGLIILGLAL